MTILSFILLFNWMCWIPILLFGIVAWLLGNFFGQSSTKTEYTNQLNEKDTNLGIAQGNLQNALFAKEKTENEYAGLKNRFSSLELDYQATKNIEPQVIEKEIEIIKEVPVEVIKEVHVEVIREVEIVKEVPVEKLVEIIKEVEVIKEVPVEMYNNYETLKAVEVIKEVPVEVIKEIEIINEVLVEVIKEVEVIREIEELKRCLS